MAIAIAPSDGSPTPKGRRGCSRCPCAERLALNCTHWHVVVSLTVTRAQRGLEISHAIEYVYSASARQSRARKNAAILIRDART